MLPTLRYFESGPVEVSDWPVEIHEQYLKCLGERDAIQEKLDRAIYIAEHLFQMIPQSVWRDAGGDDGQGHYEGDYFAEQVREELKELACP